MAALRTMVATMAAVALVGYVQATERPLPPCLDPFQPFVYSGCFQETSGQQILPYRSQASSDTMTVEQCTAECKGNGYRYAGLVYYGVCYCGQTVNGAAVAESQCNLPCNGNKTETCGANGIFSVWTDPTFEPIDEVTIEDYHALGCYTDDSSLGRALVYRQNQVDSASMTTEKCLQACRDGGFPFAGTEFGGECYCGVVLANDTVSTAPEQCDLTCNGNSAQTCGGRGRLNLYVAHELQSLQPCGYVSSSSMLPASTTTSSTSTSSTSEASTTSCDSTTSSTSSSRSSSVSTTSSAPSSTITSTSTTSVGTSTTTSSSACVSTTVVPSDCEYKCGKWCSSPLPDWDDVKTCKGAWSTCALQVASCFKQAGWPDVLDCFDFGEWCADISTYCDSNPWGGCRKTDFWGKKPPKGGAKPSVTKTITTTCAPSTTTKPATTTTKPATTTTKPATTTSKPSSTTKCPIPTPTNICTQPSNPYYGYGPGKPVGGIEMPVVTCNDLAEDWPGYPFKQYNDAESRNCRKYQRSQCGSACADACKEQYEDCVDVYAEGCRRNRKARDESGKKSNNYFEFAGSVEKRTFRWNDSWDTATWKCKAQYDDCVRVNKGVTGAGKCPKFGGW